MAERGALTERDIFWLEHVRACGAGELKAYAEARDLDVRALYEAKARLRRKGALPGATAPRVVRVEHARMSGATGPAYCRVHFPNGVSVELACAPEQWSALFASVTAQP
jgi:hypothetical protein